MEKEKNYFVPQVEVISVDVEQGFASSQLEGPESENDGPDSN